MGGLRFPYVPVHFGTRAGPRMESFSHRMTNLWEFETSGSLIFLAFPPGPWVGADVWSVAFPVESWKGRSRLDQGRRLHCRAS